jgi:hypothetical protein
MKLLRFLPFLIIGIFIILLLLVTILSIKSSKDNSAYINTLLKCEFDPGPIKASQFIDLDPTIPHDSKPTFLIKRANGDYEMISFSTDEQIVKYLKTLKENFCFVASFLPACMVGHYAGEPPGREPCIVPTPNWNQRISEAYNRLVGGPKP